MHVSQRKLCRRDGTKEVNQPVEGKRIAEDGMIRSTWTVRVGDNAKSGLAPLFEAQPCIVDTKRQCKGCPQYGRKKDWCVRRKVAVGSIR